MILADCGTSYTKILDTSDSKLTIIDTRTFVQNNDVVFDGATGHLGRKKSKFYKNELVCLALGSKSLVNQDSFCVIDVGGRDTKLIEYKNRKPKRLDWNTACGANTGFTLELVGKYYDIDYAALPTDDSWIDITCGVFGIERIFDQIIDGIPQDIAVSRFVHGMARNVFRMSEDKDKFYLSGGLTENACFIRSLSRYAKVVCLGRGVLLEGLKIAVTEKVVT